MKLGPWELRRHATAREVTAPKADDPRGASGTINLDGFLQTEEYNPDLVGRAGTATYQRMLYSDASVQEAIEHLYSPIKNASWEVQPPDDPDDDELTATALAQAALFDWLEHPWLEHLDNVLEFLPYGHSVVEPTWQVVERELRIVIPPAKGAEDQEPTIRVLPNRQWLTLDTFAPRLQDTLYKWNTENGKLQSITQQAFKDGDWGLWELPVEEIIVFTHKKRGDEFTGRSILRPAVKAFKLKELVEKVSTIAIERHGVGLLTGYMPRDRADDAQAAARLEQILQDVRAGAFGYALLPGPKATSQQDGYLLEILSPSGGIPDFGNFLEYLRSEIKAAVLARFAELGHGKTGARATGDVQSIVWFSKLHEIGRYIAEQHDPIIRRLVDANLPGITRYPKLTVTDIEVRNLAEFAQAMSQLAASQAVSVDKPFRDYVRQGIGAPEEQDPPEETGPQPGNVDANGNPIEPLKQQNDPPAE